MRTEILPAGGFGNISQCFLVQFGGGVYLAGEHSQHALVDDHFIGAHADSVNLDSGLLGQVGGLARLYFAGGIGAVGQQYQHALGFGPVEQAFNRQANGIANGGLFSGEANLRFLQQFVYRVAVESQWCLQIGPRAEEDQSQPVGFAPFDKLADNVFDDQDAWYLFVFHHHVRRFHAAGNIHRQQEVAATGGNADCLADPLWSGRGGKQ